MSVMLNEKDYCFYSAGEKRTLGVVPYALRTVRHPDFRDAERPLISVHFVGFWADMVIFRIEKQKIRKIT